MTAPAAAAATPLHELVGPIAADLGLAEPAVARTLALLDDGNTVPFITRYRKEATGGLDEVGIRAIQDRADKLRELAARRASIAHAIDAQGKLTPDLIGALARADTLAALEDLYLPYKQKRQTRAAKARAAGLEPLAALFRDPAVTDASLAERAAAHVDPAKGVATVEDAIEGACDIVAESVAEDAETRQLLRGLYRSADMSAERAKLAKADDRTYETYEGFRAPVGALKHHQVLALDRGEREGQLSVSVEVDRERAQALLHERHGLASGGPRQAIEQAMKGAWRRLLVPALERELRASLTEGAQARAIEEFARNLKPLLLAPPVANRRILAIDPGQRTGCKLAALDAEGNLLEHATVFPHPPQADRRGAERTILALVAKHRLDAIAIGNGTASRETEEVVAEALRNAGLELPYTIVNEAGASVYSASEVAREEHPDLDATVRGTLSIGRRLQDPLAELVKIDARSIGVGLYQHDLDQKALARAVDAVVEDCVNWVGVELNTASAPLLTRVAGLGEGSARAIVEARRARGGRFQSRQDLLEVRGIGPRTFEQCAGFLRVRGGAEPLDATAVHPESYDVARRLLARLGQRLGPDGQPPRLPERVPVAELSRELGVGTATLADIVAELGKPGRDPREDLPPIVFRRDVLRMEDLERGQELEGTVRNVVPFGAFVDIGVKQDGLVHVSQLADRFVEDPHEVVKVGDRVRVKVVEVDVERGRIGLTMRRNAGATGGGGGGSAGGASGAAGAGSRGRTSGSGGGSAGSAGGGAAQASRGGNAAPQRSGKADGTGPPPATAAREAAPTRQEPASRKEPQQGGRGAGSGGGSGGGYRPFSGLQGLLDQARRRSSEKDN